MSRNRAGPICLSVTLSIRLCLHPLAYFNIQTLAHHGPWRTSAGYVVLNNLIEGRMWNIRQSCNGWKNAEVARARCVISPSPAHIRQVDEKWEVREKKEKERVDSLVSYSASGTCIMSRPESQDQLGLGPRSALSSKPRPGMWRTGLRGSIYEVQSECLSGWVMDSKPSPPPPPVFHNEQKLW